MAWLAVDKDKTENKYSVKPKRHYNGILYLWTTKGKGIKTELPSGSILKLIGRSLTWKDEPVEIK